MDLTDLSVATGLTIGVTEAVKRSLGIQDRFVPVVNLAIGIGLALLFVSADRAGALTGIFAALSASGLYSNGRTVAGV